MIADYQYYTDVYKGKAITTAQDYDFYAERATDEINAYPIALVNDQDALKKCQCRLADVLFDSSKKMNVASESVNGYYTVSYSSALTDEQVRKQIANIISTYIGRFLTRRIRNILY